MEPALSTFYAHLNDAVMTTNAFADGVAFRKRYKMFDYAYCGLNPMYRTYLSFDLDKPGSAFAYEQAGLPPPTITTINPANAHCHMLYQLRTPVACHEKARSQPQDYFEAIQREMERRLGADMAFNHTLTKNPLHPRWRVITTPMAVYDLQLFREYIDLPHMLPKVDTSDKPFLGRNDRLFRTLSRWAYGVVKQSVTLDRWQAVVRDMADVINASFAEPLGEAEVKATSRSVAKYVWKKRSVAQAAHEPVMQFEQDVSATERMKLGAGYTNAKRREKSLTAVQNAYDALRAGGNAVSVSQLVAHTGMNIKTVRKYAKEIGACTASRAVCPDLARLPAEG